MRLFLFWLCFLASLPGVAQTAFQQDLLLFKKALTGETMSFKGQMRGPKLAEWNQRFDAIYQDTSLQERNEQFFALASLLLPLNDGHLGLYQLMDSATPKPVWSTSPDKEAAALPPDTMGGIYLFAGMAEVKVLRKEGRSHEAVVVQSFSPLLQKGQCVARWFWADSGFDGKAVYYHPLQKSWLYYSAERWQEGQFVQSKLYGLPAASIIRRKGLPATDFGPVTSQFSLRKINADWQHLILPHFNGYKNLMRERATAFADSVEPLLQSKNLLVDLRANTGGSELASKPFLQLVRRFVQSGGRLHVLVNAHTLSRGELFTLQLKKLEGTKVYGATTKGTLAYGSNEGRRILLPHSRVIFYPTDLWSGNEAMRLEGKGIEPDHRLLATEDWVAQVLALN